MLCLCNVMPQQRRDLRADWLANPDIFSGLEPLHATNYGSGEKVKWLFRCSCGQEFVARGENVIRGTTCSCGCYRKQVAAANGSVTGGWNKLSDYMGAKRWIYTQYRIKAEKRGYTFLVSFPQFCYLLDQPCYICGAEPSNTFQRRDINYTYRYNGIDRLDNSRGYEDDNVATCCKVCNMAKRTMSLNDFYRWIASIQAER